MQTFVLYAELAYIVLQFDAVKCQILENGSHLIDMTLTVPTQTEAEAIVNNWNRKNQEIYALLLSQLL